MKLNRINYTLIFLAFAFSIGSCDKKPSEKISENVGAGQVIPDDQKPVLKFKESSYNFKSAKEGAEVSHDFEFTNEGKTDLLISNAVASCGCTVPEWPKEPIPPGVSGKIKATFNTTGKSGQQHKSITITANTKPEKTEVFIEGEVIKENKTE
jgi:hypothetical protein